MGCHFLPFPFAHQAITLKKQTHMPKKMSEFLPATGGRLGGRAQGGGTGGRRFTGGAFMRGGGGGGGRPGGGGGSTPGICGGWNDSILGKLTSSTTTGSLP